MYTRKYLFNTRTHVAYELPDPQYMIDIYMTEHSVSMYVMETLSSRVRETFRVDKRKVSYWEDVVEEFKRLADKKYCAQVRHKSVTYHRQRAGF